MYLLLQDVDLTHGRISKIENLEALYQVEVKTCSNSLEAVFVISITN